MAIELKIPSLGESISEVQIGNWLKSQGDAVKQDEPLVVIDSEKSTFELPAPQVGRLTKIIHQAGERVKVGSVIAEMEGDGAAEEANANGNRAGFKPELSNSPAKDRDMYGTAAEEPQASVERKTASPIAAEKEKPEAGKVEKESASPQAATKIPSPTPQDTQIKAPQPVQAGADHREEVVPMTMLRRTIARRLLEAQQTMAMLTTFNEADMSVVQALRKEHQEAFEKRYQVKLGLMSFFVKAAVGALEQFPVLNAEVRGDDIVYRNFFDIGVAVGTERGLAVPILRNAGHLTFADLEKNISDFGKRAKTGQLKPDELTGGTFTITNGGVFGSLLSTPIINPPQSAILGLHSIQERPVAAQGQVVIRPMMYLALTYDHRLVDGREAVLFLRRVKELIENPVRQLLEI